MKDKHTNPFFLADYGTPHGTFPFHLLHLEHYREAVEKGIEEENKEIEGIVANEEPPTFENTILALEQAGELLETTTTVFGNLLSCHATDGLHELAQEIMPRLTEHSNNISLNPELFARIKHLHDHIKELRLDGEQKQLTEKYYKNFVRSGALLQGNQREEYRNLTKRLSVLTVRFEQNELADQNSFSMLLTEEEELKGLPATTRKAAADNAKEKGQEGFLFTLDAPSYVPFMKYSARRDLRERMHRAYNTIGCKDEATSNVAIVKEIANIRLRIARLLGYATYADFVLSNRMAENRANVYDLLDKLLAAYKPAAKKELDAVAARAAEKDGISKLMPWDWAYYSEQLRKESHDIDEEKLRKYFNLENVVQGVFGLATTLYGIRFKPNPDIPHYHPDVQTFDVNDSDGRFLGVLYMDFYPRATKQSGAWMTSYREQYKKDGTDVRPHISIVTNFTKPTASQPSLLTHGEVVTLLHEFGHALHGLLSDVNYKSLSGTNVYRDFVELPSQFMENYAYEEKFLDTFARNIDDGTPIPMKEVQKIKDAMNFNVGYACLRQLSFGYLDMAWYDREETFEGDVEQFEENAWSKAQILPHVEGTCMSTHFGHIFPGGYAAGYYSYKWAEVLEADAFSLFQERGVFDKATAASFRANILSQGGADEPMNLYVKFRGRRPTIDALLDKNGVRKEA